MTTQFVAGNRLSARRSLGLAISLIPAASLIVAAVVLAPRLGPTIASHWTVLDRPDGFASTWVSFAVVAVVVGVLTAATGVVLIMARSRSIARLWSTIGVLVTTVLAVAWVVAAVATASASRPEDAVLGWGLAITLAGVPLAALEFVTVDGSDLRRTTGSQVAPATLQPGERIAWVGRTGSRLFLLLGVALCIGGVILAIVFARSTDDASASIAGIVTIVAGIAVLALADVTLSIDDRGVRLVSSVLRVPLFRIPLGDVADVVVETIEPLRWGGWGLRFSGSGRAYVTGRAEGLVVARNNGVPTAITIPHASEAASVLEALSRR